MRFSIKESAGKFSRYLRDTRSELRKVLWPSRKQTIAFTVVVVSSVIVVCAVMWALDSIFSSVFGLIMR